MSEIAPTGSNPRMTKAQVRKYVRDMKQAQEDAKKRLEKAETSWDLAQEKKELEHLENLLDDL